MQARTYTTTERRLLWAIAVVGLVGPNGVFVYHLLFARDTLAAAFSNPVALAFIVDALAATVLLAYLFARWQVSRLSWRWFVVLALAGGLLFAIPAYVLLGQPQNRDE